MVMIPLISEKITGAPQHASKAADASALLKELSCLPLSAANTVDRVWLFYYY